MDHDKVPEDWVRGVDVKMNTKGSKNLSACGQTHGTPSLYITPKEREVEFFSCKLQPLDLGITCNFKLHYCKALVQHAIHCADVRKKDEMKFTFCR